MDSCHSHQRPVTVSLRLRSYIFFVLYNLLGICHSFLCVTVGLLMPFERRYRFINLWTVGAMWLLKHLCGVRIEVKGLEHLPPAGTPYVVIANHQSSWETFYLQLLISPQATVLKRELLWIPFFGWGLALLKPIHINRSKGSAALKSVLAQGKDKLNAGVPVVIYPEGTRQAPGTLGSFNHGGSMLACKNNVPVLPVVHNSGDCWPARSLLKFPGTITLQFGPCISTEGQSAKAVTQQAERWIREHY